MNKQITSPKYQELLQQATVNINGEIIPASDAKISIFDRGFLYGDSIYEVTYGEDYHLLHFDEHIRRLKRSADLIGMNLFISEQEIIENTLNTLRSSHLKDCYVRIIITRGETEMSLDPNTSTKNNLIIIVKPKPIYPASLYQHGIKLAIVSVLRNDRKATNPSAKSGNYLNNVMAMAEAREKGFEDAIMINQNGNITEGTTFNVWMIRNGIIQTAPATSGLLEGITRQIILDLCEEQRLPCKIENFTPEDILKADEAFITSSTRGIIPVAQINDKLYSPKRPIIQNLTQYFQAKILEHKKNKKYYYGP
jgi:branched-chain amino acid aminotransferase